MNLFARFLFLALVAVHAAADEEAVVRASLESSVDSVAAGNEFVLGARFAVESNWHVYWRNPGDSGLPLKPTLLLPDGLTAGDWQWPTPHRIEQAGLVAFGYSDEVVLTTTVTAAKNLPNSLVIEAKLSWLVCKESCIPGSQVVKLTLPLGDGAKSSQADDLRVWQGRSPGSPTAEQLSVKRSELAEAGKSRRIITVELAGVLGENAIDFIPEPSDALAVEYAAIIVTGGKISIPVTLLQTTPKHIEGIVLTTDGVTETGWLLSIPLTAR